MKINQILSFLCFTTSLHAQLSTADFTGSWAPQQGDARNISITTYPLTKVFICIDGKIVPVTEIKEKGLTISFKADYSKANLTIQKLILVDKNTLLAVYIEGYKIESFTYYRQSSLYSTECWLGD